MDWISIIVGLLCSGTCCLLFVLLFLFVVGMMIMRKRGKKKKLSVRETIKVGADATSAFVRGSKSREELLREAELADDEDDD